MIDQYSPQQLGSSRGKPIKPFHPSIKQQEEGNIPNTIPCCPFLSPWEQTCLAKCRWFPLSTKKNLSVNVKIINKVHTVIVTVLSAVIQHGNNSSGSCWRCSAACRKAWLPAAASSEVLLLNVLGGRGKQSIWQSNISNKRRWELHYGHQWRV